MAFGLYAPYGEYEVADVDWSAQPPRSHQATAKYLSREERHLEQQRGGQQLARSQSFTTSCSQDQLNLRVTLEKPETAKRLLSQAKGLSFSMHDMPSLLLEQFIEKDYGDDLLLLTATEITSGRLVGLVFWRYLRKIDDDLWEHVQLDWTAALGPRAGRAFASSWSHIELLCTDEAYRGHGVGKLLLTAALAYSAVMDGKTASVLVLGGTGSDDNAAARELYTKMGFEEMPLELFSSSGEGSCVHPDHVLVIWNIKRSLRNLYLSDVDGTRKGTRVPQLTAGPSDGEAGDELTRLDSAVCSEIVGRLTGQQ
mmetsp:Transcript_21881/g.62091  ORF Transcript_21881/g.62091 Transcript_21881/m.62091 type:complete len:311 (+) Transcript_21881:145-1077(+)